MSEGSIGPSLQVAPIPDTPAPQHRWSVMAAGALTAFVFNLDQTTVLLATPTISDELPATLSETQWVLSGFLLPLAALVILGGTLADRFAPLRILQVGLTAFIIGSVASALSSTIGVLVAARVIAGLGAALAFPASVALVRRSLGGPDLTMALGLWFSGALAGSAIGPIAGGLLLRASSWSSVFWMSAALTAAALLLVSLLVSATPPGARARLWLLPNAVAAVGMALSTWGLINAGSDGWGSAEALVPIGLGAAILGVLAAIAVPRTAGWDVDTRRLASGLAMMTLAILGVVGTVFLVITHMQTVLGYSPLRAGFAFLPFGAVAAILAPMGARLIRRYDRRTLVLAAAGLEVVGLFGLSRTDPSSSYVSIGVFLALLGAAMAIFPAVSLDLALSSADDDRGGVISGAHTASLQFGQLVSIAVVGSLVSASVGGIYRSNLVDAGLSTEVSGDIVADLARGESVAPPTASVADGVRYVEIGEAAFTTALGRAVLTMLGAVIILSILIAVLLKEKRPTMSTLRLRVQ